MLRVKSVKSPIDPEEDGFRILAARFRGRGLPASRYDAWVASLGPSELLTIKDHGQKFTLRLIKALAEKQDVTLIFPPLPWERVGERVSRCAP